jgi:hypothetical protein
MWPQSNRYFIPVHRDLVNTIVGLSSHQSLMDPDACSSISPYTTPASPPPAKYQQQSATSCAFILITLTPDLRCIQWPRLPKRHFRTQKVHLLPSSSFILQYLQHGTHTKSSILDSFILCPLNDIFYISTSSLKSLVIGLLDLEHGE